MYRLSEILGSQRTNTIENVQRKQALTPGEREQEEEPDIANEASEEEDEDGAVYNPKNLPLGWDGKVKNLVSNILFTNRAKLIFFDFNSPFPIGCINSMGLICTTIVKYAVITNTEDQRRFSDTLPSGGMLMECAVWEYQTRLILLI